MSEGTSNMEDNIYRTIPREIRIHAIEGIDWRIGRIQSQPQKYIDENDEAEIERLTQLKKDLRKALYGNKCEKINMRDWISVKDRLPNGDKEVFCLVTCYEIDFYDSSKFCEIPVIRVLSYLPQYQIWNIKEPVKVVAWLPLPEPYKVRGN